MVPSGSLQRVLLFWTAVSLNTQPCPPPLKKNLIATTEGPVTLVNQQVERKLGLFSVIVLIFNRVIGTG